MEPDAEPAKAKEGASPVPASAVPESAALFCLIATRSGLLSQARADEALAAAPSSGDTVAQVCVARGWLTEGQARTVLAHVGASEAPAPSVDGDESREFARLVALKRLAGDGQVDACRDLQKDLAGGAYGKLSEILVRQAARRSGGGERPAGMPNRQEAFDLYVKLKQAVQRGAVEQAGELALRLRGDPQFGRAAEAQLRRAFARRTAVDARRTGAEVTTCPACGTPGLLSETDAPTKCLKCSSSLTPPPVDGHPSG